MPRQRQLFRAPAQVGGTLNPLLQAQAGTYGTGGEIIDKTIYDTLVLSNTVNIYKMFSVPEGQQGKTKDLTNLINPSQISQGQKLTVKQIQVQYISSAARATADIQRIYSVLNHFTAEIIIPGKDNIGDWTLAELMGASTLIAFTPTAAGDNIPLIMPQYNGIKHLKIPIVLSALTSFEVRITAQKASDAALNGDFIRVGLRGILRRSS